MKKLLLLLLSAGISAGSSARAFPPQWERYTSGGYLFDMQSDRNDRGLSEARFTEELANTARTNLARQVRMRIRDSAALSKRSADGLTTVAYTSESRFSTDVELRLVETRTSYDPATKQGWAIACIDRQEACRYYRSEVGAFLNRADNTLAAARDLAGAGFKARAKSELEALLPGFEAADEAFFWLGILGLPQDECERLRNRRNEREQAVKRMAAELQHATSVFLVCTADIFGARYPTLQNELKGKLTAGGCSLADDPSQADWVVRVEVSAREYNRLTAGGRPLFFAYADAHVSIDKTITAQRICEDALSAKGGHTTGYGEAARTACRELSERLGELVLGTIRQ